MCTKGGSRERGGEFSFLTAWRPVTKQDLVVFLLNGLSIKTVSLLMGSNASSVSINSMASVTASSAVEVKMPIHHIWLYCSSLYKIPWNRGRRVSTWSIHWLIMKVSGACCSRGSCFTMRIFDCCAKVDLQQWINHVRLQRALIENLLNFEVQSPAPEQTIQHQTQLEGKGQHSQDHYSVHRDCRQLWGGLPACAGLSWVQSLCVVG